MKIKSSALLLTLLLPLSAPAADNRDPAVVKTVNLQRYAGLWYEIAHAPNFFQNGCVRSTAQYKVLGPTTVSVSNKCQLENGGVSGIEGTAQVLDRAVPAKLKVKFNSFIQGDYWIIGLDPDYRWAVVSAPAKKSLFILARKAPMEPKLLQTILRRLEADGFATSEFVFDRY